VARRVSKVDATPAVVPVECAGLGHLGISRMLQSGVDDPLVDPIEIVLGDEEGVVLDLDIEICVGELHQASLIQLHGDEKDPRLRAPEGRTVTRRMRLTGACPWRRRSRG
jgi:hypothetical protein